MNEAHSQTFEGRLFQVAGAELLKLRAADAVRARGSTSSVLPDDLSVRVGTVCN